jgi:hypothetical protein
MDSDAAQGGSRKNCHKLVSGYRNPTFKKFDTFADAVTWMVMKGKYIDGKPISNHELDVCRAACFRGYVLCLVSS